MEKSESKFDGRMRRLYGIVHDALEASWHGAHLHENKRNVINFCEIRFSHSSGAESTNLLGRDAVLLGEYLQKARRILTFSA